MKFKLPKNFPSLSGTELLNYEPLKLVMLMKPSTVMLFKVPLMLLKGETYSSVHDVALDTLKSILALTTKVPLIRAPLFFKPTMENTHLS